MKPPVEPFKIKVVEPVTIPSEQRRKEAIREARNFGNIGNAHQKTT